MVRSGWYSKWDRVIGPNHLYVMYIQWVYSGHGEEERGHWPNPNGSGQWPLSPSLYVKWIKWVYRGKKERGHWPNPSGLGVLLDVDGQWPLSPSLYVMCIKWVYSGKREKGHWPNPLGLGQWNLGWVSDLLLPLCMWCVYSWNKRSIAQPTYKCDSMAALKKGGHWPNPLVCDVYTVSVWHGRPHRWKKSLTHW